jgi:L-rhamnose mutarotase
MTRYCFALDLVDDPALIEEYEQLHKPQNAWPENIAGIKAAGIIDMQIFRTGNRMIMIMDTDDSFSFERKALLDAANPRLQEWEELMWKFQLALPWAKPGEKWLLMNKIFQL